jgi:hypothetical protein
MSLKIEKLAFGGWANNLRLTNGRIEAIMTADVGPRVIRFGFVKGPNLFAELPGQIGGAGERNGCCAVATGCGSPGRQTAQLRAGQHADRRANHKGRVCAVKEAGPHTHIEKRMDLSMDPRRDRMTVVHTLTNRGRKPFALAPWALSAMAPGGMEIVPLPAKIAHTARLTNNQSWSIWGYTDFTDKRWMLGSRYVFLKQRAPSSPTKLGLAQHEGWVAYQLKTFVFVKRFGFIEGALYPDGGMNFETFTNDQFLEIESLAPMTTLAPGKSAKHTEVWELFRDVPRIRTEADADRELRRRIR